MAFRAFEAVDMEERLSELQSKWWAMRIYDGS